MKKRSPRLFTTLFTVTLLTVLCLVGMAACTQTPPDEETLPDSTAHTPTDTPAAETAEDTTEAPTDKETEEATTEEAVTEDVTTEEETLPDVEPSLLYIIKDIRYIGETTNDEDWNDMVRLYTSLQGRLNKSARKTGTFVYQMFDPTDEFWLDYISGEGKMLHSCTVTELSTWDELWTALGDDIKAAGLVVWDPNAPATANVAATVCSVDGYLPVRYDTDADSLYTWLTANGVEVKLSLVDKFSGEKGTKIPDTDVNSTGSVKCDPYLWALELYMDRCSSTMLAYALDGASQVATNSVYQKAEQTTPAYNQLYSHDYYIYNGCFFIDLTCIDTEKPCDDPKQPRGCDAKTLATILETMRKRNEGQFTKLMGFPPWYMKYTTHLNNGKTAPVTLEWQFVAFITEYNFIKEADAAHPAWMTNASVYCQYDTSATEFINNDVTVTETYDENVRYFSIYIGDYDSSAWLKNMVPGNFTDENRGQIPMMWAFNPNLSDRVPMIFDYVYENKTALDYFTTGDTGAGYVFPSRLKDLDMWVEYNKTYLSRFDMDIVGFIIDDRALSLDILKAYGQITKEGAFTNQGTAVHDYLTVLDQQTVFLRMWDIYPNDEKTHLEEMYQQFERYGSFNFAAFRTIVQSTTSIVNCAKEFEAYANAKGDGYTYKYVDTYTLFDLIRQSGQGGQYLTSPPEGENPDGFYGMSQTEVDESFAEILDGLFTGKTTETITTAGIGSSFYYHFPDITYVNGEYWGYYITYATNTGKGGVGLATSTDGLNWTDKGCVLQPDQDYDCNGAYFAGVWLDTDGKFYLTYECKGGEGTEYGTLENVALATSTDGINWTKEGVILYADHDCWWQKANVGTPDLYKVGDIWYLFFHGFDYTDCRVGVAYGKDLHNLTVMREPVIDTKDNTAWSGTIGRRDVIYCGGYYYMVYEISTDQAPSGGYGAAQWTHMFARSRDLITWETTSGPLLTQENPGFGYDGTCWMVIDKRLYVFMRQNNTTTAVELTLGA